MRLWVSCSRISRANSCCPGFFQRGGLVGVHVAGLFFLLGRVTKCLVGWGLLPESPFSIRKISLLKIVSASFKHIFNSWLFKSTNTLRCWIPAGLGCWIPNPGVLCSKPLGGFRLNSAFHPSKVDQMSTRNLWKLSDKK